MKPGTWMHTLAVVLSSLASAVAHPVHAKVSESKFSKKKKVKEGVSLRVVDLTSDNPPAGDPPFAQAAERYPWRRNIVTTTFWVGERPSKKNPVPNHISCWDEHWAKNYGGTDDPEPNARRDFIPVNFTPGQNPFCAAPPLAAKLRRKFPHSLHGAPALLPAENSAFRMALETWFDSLGIRPRAVAEFEDTALMHPAAVDGVGFVPIHTVIARRAARQNGWRVIGRVRQCTGQFFAITAERRLKHPAIVAITEHAQSSLFTR